MAKINVLPKNVSELIAAGEVVDRPSAVIKELVENSIDSGATAITVEIKNGGRTFMRVTDNGCGFEKEDIPTAFLRHATSKIKTGADLDAIYTLGFRGEALASICAVSRVTLITRTADDEFGYHYKIDGGEEILFEETGCALGTTFIVEDLFYNTPARMKFLKKDNTESNVVVGIIERIALSHPEISFKLIKDGKQVINTPGDKNLKSACFSIFGAEFSNSLVEVNYTLDDITVTGFVTKPTAAKKNRTMQFFFLNGRYVRTKTGIAALEQAYKNRIMSGMYPGCALNVEINANFVDVNVHPSKIEVRFSNEKSVFRAVYYAVMSALDSDVSRVVFKSKIDQLVEEDTVEQIKISIPEKSVEAKKQDFFKKTTVEEFKKEYIQKPVQNNNFIKPETNYTKPISVTEGVNINSIKVSE
ncbi:MAG: DNA mismatch repair endonuclease MutL, partial [Clostridia bacterium]|nr:DNA mismatch repair endonuclease MutL [Clostridia bacterium]